MPEHFIFFPSNGSAYNCVCVCVCVCVRVSVCVCACHVSVFASV